MKRKYATLHRYWLRADSARLRFYQDAAAGTDFIDTSGGMYLWYALLFVAIEGYQQLGPSYKISEIDNLLGQKANLLYKLRRLRNVVCHVPENFDYNDKREMEFFTDSTIKAKDILEIHELLGKKFLEKIK